MALPALTLAAFVASEHGSGQATGERRLTFLHTHTGETISVVYKRNGAYLPLGLRRLDHFLRDHRTQQAHEMDPTLYDMLFDPGEFNNLAGQRRHSRRVRQMHGALVREIGEDPETTERCCRGDCATGYSRSDREKEQQKT